MQRVLWMVAGSLGGGILGWLVFLAGGKLPRPLLFILVGALVGSAGVALVRVFGRDVRLEQIKVTVPALGEATLGVTPKGRVMAWRIFVEIVTRVAIQPLPQEVGRVREALDSLHQLFAHTRATLEASEPSSAGTGGVTVEEFAITMLNRELRPFLSKWHPRLDEWEKSNPGRSELDWPEDGACRNELFATQQRIRRYADEFAKLARLRSPETMIGPAAGAPTDS